MDLVLSVLVCSPTVTNRATTYPKFSCTQHLSTPIIHPYIDKKLHPSPLMRNLSHYRKPQGQPPPLPAIDGNERIITLF